jgi:hypothetical protein
MDMERVKTRPEEGDTREEIKIDTKIESAPKKPVQIVEICGYEIAKATTAVNIHEGDSILVEITLNPACTMKNI